ncbi:hypothetical protein C4579_04390 [Candidatus Microgenomates bacterium]|nr:MAG: hypothetical protein C4579_04390 [Candidatus Microgenomates bacterium]
MIPIERCIDVDLSKTHWQTCERVARRAVVGWRQQGIAEADIIHSLDHVAAGIWPTFATPEELDAIKHEAAIKLGVSTSCIQVDGIRIDGLVNLLVRSGF